MHLIEDAVEYLDAIDRRARELSALEGGVPRFFVTTDHPLVDHIRVTSKGTTFEVQVVSYVGVSLPPAEFDEDPTQAFTEAWRGDEKSGCFLLDAEAVAILITAIEREAGMPRIHHPRW